MHHESVAAFLAQLFFWVSLYVVHPRPSSLEQMEAEIAERHAREDVVLAQVQIPPQQPYRVDTFDRYSNRTGYIVVDPRTGRVDEYDKYSNRVGSGRITSPPPQPGQPYVITPDRLEVRPLR